MNFFGCVNLLPHFGKAVFELKPLQIWLDKKFVYFYAHNLIEEQVLLIQNPIVGWNNNFVFYLQKIIHGEETQRKEDL